MFFFAKIIVFCMKSDSQFLKMSNVKDFCQSVTDKQPTHINLKIFLYLFSLKFETNFVNSKQIFAS